jgi:hypothetical protein
MAKISQLTVVAAPDGNEQVVLLKDGVTQRARLRDLASFGTAIARTRDPLTASVDAIARSAFGAVTFANAQRSIAPRPIIIASVGDSLGNSAGASRADLAPAFQLAAKLRNRLPGRTVEVDVYNWNGSWCSQIHGQINNFTRAPDIVVLNGGLNDGIANIFMGYQGFVGPNNTYGGYEQALEGVLTRLSDDMGILVVNVIDPYPHPGTALANGRLTVTPEVLMTFPVQSLIAFYLPIVFTAHDQRISAYAVNAQFEYVPFDLFKQYNNGVFGIGSKLIEFQPQNNGATGALHQVVEISPDGFWVRVDGTILADKDDGGWTSVRQCDFDNETQVVPPLSQAIVQRDLGAGVDVDVSWRHYELYALNRRVAARNAVVTVDWAGRQGRKLTATGAYNGQYNPGEDFHGNDSLYEELDEPMDDLARDIATGNVIGGHIYV